MSSDSEKLQSINTGDQVSWYEGNEQQSGTVEGWHFKQTHSLIVALLPNKQVTIPLCKVVSRQRATGTNRGFLSWE